MNIRYEIYRDVHKGIRKQLFDLALLAGSTDFHDDDAIAQLCKHFMLTRDMLEIHSHSEDTHVQPLVDELDKSQAKVTEEKHASLEASFAALLKQLNNTKASAPDAVSQGRDIYLNLSRFVADYLHHIADEEQIIHELLIAAHDDDFLDALSIKIRSEVPPPAMVNFWRCMVPAMTNPDRGIMFNGIKQGAPPHVFEGACNLAQSVLMENDWQKLSAQLV